MDNVIAAVRNEADFETAVSSDTEIIFHLGPNVMNIGSCTKKAHAADKKLFIHMDLAEGIGKDRYGILLTKKMGIDGIISTRTNIIKAAKELNVFTVQRFFIVDSHSVETTIESLKVSKADMIEIMPGVVTKVISALRKRIAVPIIAGGIIETEAEVRRAVESGAYAVSSGSTALWIKTP